MRHFFYIVVGGTFAVACGIILAIAGKHILVSISPNLAQWKLSSLSSFVGAVMSEPNDGTSISGIKRIIRYSASEEEGLMTLVTLSIKNLSAGPISANAYIVKDLKTGKIVTEYNANKLLPIASLTKLVTASVAKRLIKPDSRIEISKDISSVYGNTAEFKVGETLLAKELLYPLLMVSSNDAAEALARNYGRQKFLKAMNDFVQEIGAYRTTFTDPSGLSPNNRSTASDVAIILAWLKINDPDLIAITELKTKTTRFHTWVNPAHFLSWSNYRGGKNGYTSEANRTGAGLFEMGKNKDIYVVVVLGSKARDNDMVKLLGKI